MPRSQLHDAGPKHGDAAARLRGRDGLRVHEEASLEGPVVLERRPVPGEEAQGGHVPLVVVRAEGAALKTAVAEEPAGFGPPMAHRDVAVDLIGARRDARVVRVEPRRCGPDGGVEEERALLAIREPRGTSSPKATWRWDPPKRGSRRGAGSSAARRAEPSSSARPCPGCWKPRTGRSEPRFARRLCRGPAWSSRRRQTRWRAG